MSGSAGTAGVLSRHGSSVGVRLEHTYPVRPGLVWQAVTEPEQLAGWFATVNGELVEGGRCHVVFDAGNPEQQINGTIEECIQGERVVLSWEMEDQPESTVAATISPEGPGTVLSLEHHDMRDDTAAAYAAGWQAYLEALEVYLAGGAGAGELWEARWQELLPAYLHQVAEL